MNPNGISVEEAKRRLGEDRIASQKQVALRNWKRIFGAIVIVDGPSARDIADITGLPQSTIGAVLDQMEKRGLIEKDRTGECGPGRGRRPVPIRINNQKHHIAGIEVLADRLVGTVVDLSGQPVVESQQIPLERTRAAEPVDQDSVVDGVRDLVELLTTELRRQQGGPGAHLRGLGVQVAGHVDGRAGLVVFSPSLRWGSRWHTPPVQLRQRLRDATRLPTVVENDVNTLAVAQQWFGAGRNTNDFLVVLVHPEGIGSGLVIDGELHGGASGVAGEIGHSCLNPHGPVCQSCGAAGCLEELASQRAIRRHLSPARTFADARDLAERGDQRALRALREAGTYLGLGVGNVLNIVNPTKVIFIGDTLVPSVRDPARLVLVDDAYHESVFAAIGAHGFSTVVGDTEFAFVEDNAWRGAQGAATPVIHAIIAGGIELPREDAA